MSFLPKNWENILLSPIKDDARREGTVDARMYAVCGIPYGPLTISRPAKLSNGATPEDMFFHKLARLITKAELGDLYILLAAIISTKMVRAKHDDPKSPEDVLTTVLLRDGGKTETFRRGILGLLVYLVKLLGQESSSSASPVCPPLLAEVAPAGFGSDGRINYSTYLAKPQSPLGLAHRISCVGDSERLIGENMWGWINEKRAPCMFDTPHLGGSSDTAQRIPRVLHGSVECDKVLLWCAVSTTLFLSGHREDRKLTDI